ncbi:SiaB family protein kinase [Desulfobacula phenolica]|uniref:Uncharacterized protein n=1 Tax=Desulfobacula phenolica TaxID=90732 RepID=A0A1H2GSM7_9BACT|nr:SiaB family protein kinase [Desulfobacula phenolica]SDU22525.1 hypothetical protein SAMN04487931_105363 [Desulfobacula phenolica]
MINDMFPFYQTMKKEGIIFCFSGPTSQSVVEGIGDALRQKMELEAMTQTASRHVFSIFVEQMQNVVHYSAEKDDSDQQETEGCLSYGIIVVGRDGKDKFYISSGNYIHKDDTRRIVDLLDKLKGMDKNELKIFYKEQRKLERRKGGKGAGLGMIETARKASRPIEYTLTGSTDKQHDFISIKAVI